MPICDKCGNTGWIKVAEYTFNKCDCPVGQKLRGFTTVVDIANEDRKIEQAFDWFKRKMGRVT
jgi:hypothetical protein